MRAALWILLAILIPLSLGEGHNAIDYGVLSERICYYETRHLIKYPEKRAAAVSYKQALGPCQILPTTARDHDCNWWEINDYDYAKMCAERILEACSTTSVEEAAYCYNHDSAYTKIIVQEYAEGMREWSWAELLWAEYGL